MTEQTKNKEFKFNKKTYTTTNNEEKQTDKTVDNGYGYYSRVLNKVFNTLAELQEAEQAEKKAQLAKAEASNNKKADALKVEDAFKAYNTAKRERNEALLLAKKDYLKKKADIEAEYNTTASKYAESVEVAEKAYNAAIKEFTAKHPEGYHFTLRDGDNVVTLSKEIAGIRPNISSNFWDDFFTILSRF